MDETQTPETTQRKLNCWEVLLCGREVPREPGDEVCPAALDTASDGLNDGKNAGRMCWAVGGTLCYGRRQGTPASKHSLCHACRFFRQVKREEGPDFQLFKLPTAAVSEEGGKQQTAWLRRAVAELDHLLKTCKDIIRHAGIQDVLHTLAEQACEACNAERGIVYLFDPDRRGFVATAMGGSGVVGFSVPIAEDSVAAYVARHEVFVNITDTSGGLEDLSPPLQMERSFEEHYGFPVRNMVALPILGEKGPDAAEGAQPVPARDVIGVIKLFNKRSGHFTGEDEWFLAEFAIIAGLALQSEHLSQRLREMHRTDREKSRFVALLMHEIVSPLATVYTCVSTLEKLRESISEEDRGALIEGALNKVLIVQELAKKLLDLAAIQEGRALADLRDVDIVNVIRDEVEKHKHAAREKDIRLRTKLPRARPRVHADRTGLELIYANLIANSIKYADRHTETIVSCRVAEHTVFTRVTDRGPGIPPEDVHRLFDEFFRCAAAAKKGIPGSGLGLTFVRTLVSRYGGSVTVDSQLGEGSTFTVTFPCA